MRRRKRPACFESLESRHLLAAASGWQVHGPGGGGALFAPAINPHDASDMYIMSDMSQVFRSQDSGATWRTLDFEQLGGSSGQPIQFTQDPDVQYSIDYAAIDQLDAKVPARSNDGGQTWEPLTDPTGRDAYYLLADYGNPDRMMVTDWANLYVSNDGGQSYSIKYSAPSDSGLHVGGAFFDGQDIYIGTNHGLLVSNDGANSFRQTPLAGFSPNEDLVTMAGATENGVTRLYAVAQSTEIWGGYSTEEWWHFSNVYRMDVGRSDWVSVTNDLPADSKPFFVDMAANDIDTVYLAGNNESSLPIIYKSTDGGGHWNDSFRWKDNENIATGWQGEGGQLYWWWGGGALGFDVDRADADNVLVTDYGFAHFSDNGGDTWQNVNVHPDDLNPIGGMTSTTNSYRGNGLSNTSVFDLTWLDEDSILAGYADIEAAISHDGGQSWSFDYDGLGQNSMYRAEVHPDTGIVYAATSTIHDVYEVTRSNDALLDPGDGKVVFSADQGQTWQTMHDFGAIVRWLELDPHQPNRMYVSVVSSTDGGIYVSNDIQMGASATWQKLTDPPRTEGHPFNIDVLDDGSLLATYAARIPGWSDPFTPSSGVFISSDGGETWQDRTDPRMQYWTRHLTVDPHDPEQKTWYAGVYSGWGGPPNDLGGLYKTTDRGATWTLLYQSHRVTSATVSPTNPDELYLTTEAEGLIYTDNLNSNRPTFSRVEGMDFRQPLEVVFNPYDSEEVWVTTFGGQIWIGTTRDGQPPTEGDFNIDGQLDCADIDALVSAIVSGDNTPVYDLSADGILGDADIEHWLTVAGQANLLSGRAYLYGDANLDGRVDVADLNVIGKNWLAEVPGWCSGDFNADGVAGANDLNKIGLNWQQNIADRSPAMRTRLPHAPLAIRANEVHGVSDEPRYGHTIVEFSQSNGRALDLVDDFFADRTSHRRRFHVC